MYYAVDGLRPALRLPSSIDLVAQWGGVKKIIGVVGSGMVGRDPFDPTCWSRAGYNLFSTLKTKGMLQRAFGVEVPHPLRGLLMIKNFHPERRIWSQRLNLDPGYYDLLTREIRRGLIPGDFSNDNVILQIGNHYNGSSASAGRIPTYSYSDANISGMMKSPFFPKNNLTHARRAFGFERAVSHDMAKIFVMSEYWRRSYIEDFGVSPSRVVNIGTGVNIDIPEVTDKDYSGKHVVFVGIDFARKGGDHLVRAFQKLHSRHPDATLHIIGPQSTPPALSLPGLKNIEFHGHLSREVPAQKSELLETLRKGTLFVLPSLFEPSGNALLEAMLFRMPVIATDDWSFPEFIVNDTGKLLKSATDATEMADKMDAYLSDPSLSERSGNAGRHLVVNRYTWDKVVDRIQKEVSADV